MTHAGDPNGPMLDDSDYAAGEYVLGTLDAAERAAAARRIAEDESFAQAVTAWEARLAALIAAAPPVAPSASLWPRVENAIVDAPAVSVGNVVSFSADVLALQRSRSRWRSVSILSGSLAAALAVFVADRQLIHPPAPQRGETYVAAVNRGGDMPALIVRVDLATHAITVRPVDAQTPSGKSLELWYIGAGKAPKSMGVVEGGKRERMPMPDNMELTNATFAVTVEPPGGSPSGDPTGPVVYKGTLIAE